MKEYIIIGADMLLSDTFDLIHALGGKVAAVYLNMEVPIPKRGPTVLERIEEQDYPIEVHHSLDHFQPSDDFLYVQGLHSPKKHTMINQLKEQFGLTFSSLIHPEAHLGSRVTIGEGVFLNAKATIAPNAVLDDFCAINRAVVIGHDAYIGKYTRIGPSVSIAGATHVGSNCSIGLAATVLDYVEIGNWSVVGAGSVVTKDIPGAMVAYGVPAKVIKENTNRN